MVKYNWHLSSLMAFIRLNLFVKIDLIQWLDKPFEPPPEPMNKITQGVLFEFKPSITLKCLSLLNRFLKIKTFRTVMITDFHR